MNKFNIKAQLDIRPLSMPDNAYSTSITRGATAVLLFNFGDKIYSFEDTDQITFMLKQDKTVYWFKMFNYFVPTKDIAPVPGKIYYTDVTHDANSTLCRARAVIPAVGESPVEFGYYEETDGNHGWKNTLYNLDERFHYNQDDCTVSLILYPEDTLLFKSKVGKPIKFEVAVRLNTESTDGFANRDTILVEPQPDIFVMNSIYSEI